MLDRYYFAAYSGGECILKCQGTDMKVTTPDVSTMEVLGPGMTAIRSEHKTLVDYIDDDGNPQQVILSANAVWTLERGA